MVFYIGRPKIMVLYIGRPKIMVFSGGTPKSIRKALQPPHLPVRSVHRRRRRDVRGPGSARAELQHHVAALSEAHLREPRWTLGCNGVLYRAP